MYIRWRKRKRQWAKNHSAFMHFMVVDGEPYPLDVHWAAVVVEPRRIDGQPRPQYIAYLGGITQSQILAGESYRFWWKVQTGLAGLNLTSAVRTRLELAIAQKVPHPNKGKRFINWDHVIAAEKVWAKAFHKASRQRAKQWYITRGFRVRDGFD